MPRTPGKYRNEHDRQRRLAYAKAYYWRDPEKHKAYQRWYQSTNAELVKTRGKRYRMENSALLAAKGKARRQSEAGRAVHNARSRAWNARNRHKKAAQALLAAAVRRGDIVRPSACSKCGVSCKPHGHHPNHDRPYRVRWLCARCHILAHQKAHTCR